MRKSNVAELPLVTVIVPVYNVERYLDECINSVLQQDWPNLEIILVDDGSEDSSPSLCDTYAEEHERVSCIHQQNKGLSGARNTGLDASHGEYITFIDSDDWVEHDMVSSLMRGMLDSDCGIGVTGFVNRYEDGSRKRISRAGGPAIMSKTEALACYLFNEQIGVCVCGGIYKRNLWDNIRCPEGRLYEDQYTTYRLLMETESVYFDPLPRYNYRQRAGSIGHTVDPARLIDLYNGAVEQYEVISVEYPEVKSDVAVGSLFWRVVYANYLLKGNIDDEVRVRDIQRFGRKHMTSVMRCNHLNSTRKCQLALFCYSFPLYRLMYRHFVINDSNRMHG